jgi:hypothetical protein
MTAPANHVGTSVPLTAQAPTAALAKPASRISAAWSLLIEGSDERSSGGLTLRTLAPEPCAAAQTRAISLLARVDADALVA